MYFRTLSDNPTGYGRGQIRDSIETSLESQYGKFELWSSVLSAAISVTRCWNKNSEKSPKEAQQVLIKK